MKQIMIATLVAAFALGTPIVASAAPPCVDVEKASAKDIQNNLNGAGEKVAKAIVTYRKAQRSAATKAGRKTWNFNNWKTLLKVSGIGHAFCEKNIAKVCFSGKVQKRCPKKAR